MLFLFFRGRRRRFVFGVFGVIIVVGGYFRVSVFGFFGISRSRVILGGRVCLFSFFRRLVGRFLESLFRYRTVFGLVVVIIVVVVVVLYGDFFGYRSTFFNDGI